MSERENTIENLNVEHPERWIDKRIPLIAEQLQKHGPDVLVVTEYWEGKKVKDCRSY